MKVRYVFYGSVIENDNSRRQIFLSLTLRLFLPHLCFFEIQVAEMTGRSGRIVRYKDGKRFHHTKRGGAHSNQKSYGLSMPQSSDECDKVNIVEKKKFMEGSKSVAIISDAASTGISLHSAEGTGAAHKRRVHFTIEVSPAASTCNPSRGVL